MSLNERIANLMIEIASQIKSQENVNAKWDDVSAPKDGSIFSTIILQRTSDDILWAKVVEGDDYDQEIFVASDDEEGNNVLCRMNWIDGETHDVIISADVFTGVIDTMKSMVSTISGPFNPGKETLYGRISTGQNGITMATLSVSYGEINISAQGQLARLLRDSENTIRIAKEESGVGSDWVVNIVNLW